MDYFKEEMERFVQLTKQRGLTLKLVEGQLNKQVSEGNRDELGIPCFYLDIIHTIKGQNGEIDIYQRADIFPNPKGVEEKIQEYYAQHGFVPITTDVIDGFSFRERYQEPSLEVRTRPVADDDPYLIFFIGYYHSNDGIVKVYKELHNSEEMSTMPYEKAFDLALDYISKK